MKRLAFVLAIVLLFAACGGSQVVEAPESPQEDYSVSYGVDEVEIPEPVAEAPQEMRPHHYGEFDRVTDRISAMSEAGIASTNGIIEFGTTLSQLQPRTANIVRGRMGDDARIELFFCDILPIEIPRWGRNFVSFEVLEVIQGDLAIGEIITIMESYYIYDRVLITRNYMPSIPHQEYILLLSNQVCDLIGEGEAVGAFWVDNDVLGRHPVLNGSADEQDFSAPIFGLGVNANVERYARMWEEVMNAFVN